MFEIELSTATWWWLACGFLIILELCTGTFYLLMLAAGLLLGGIAAHLGFSLTNQIILAAIFVGVFTSTWHIYRIKNSNSKSSASNKNVHLDIGETVVVKSWEIDRTAQVAYRGSVWKARCDGESLLTPGRFRIIAVEGNTLTLQAI